MPRTCMSCRHPDLEEINKDLIAREQLRDGDLLYSCQLLQREPVNRKRYSQSGTARHFIMKYVHCRRFLHKYFYFFLHSKKGHCVN